MANRAAAAAFDPPTPATESSSHPSIGTTTTTYAPTNPMKNELSPASSPHTTRMSDAGADSGTPGTEDDAGPTTTATTTTITTTTTTTTTAGAGRKRKSSCGISIGASTSARGVANLTPEQLAKKRANDRHAQRAIRERTKARIESLEQQVKELSSQKPFLDLQAALGRIEAVQAENRELKKGLEDIMDTIQSLLGRRKASAMSYPQSSNAVHASSASSFVGSKQFPLQNSQRSATNEPLNTDSFAYVDTPSPTTSTTTTTTTTLIGVRCNSVDQLSSSSSSSSSLRTAFDYQRYHLAHGLDFSSGEKLGFNFLLDKSQRIPKINDVRHIPGNSGLSQAAHSSLYSSESLSACSTPIRHVAPTCPLDAILIDFLNKRQRQAAQGIPRQKLAGPPYPSVSSLLNPEISVHSHPVSKLFTDILRTFPDISSLPEQVAVLYIMFLLMRWQIYPTQENYDRLPEWLTPLPSQLLTPHPVWIDYVPWPQMRDSLVTSYRNYPFENWFIPYTRTLSVNWPYEAADCLLSTGESDELVINPVFERHVRNLGNWSLGPAFAESFPALVDTTRIMP